MGYTKNVSMELLEAIHIQATLIHHTMPPAGLAGVAFPCGVCLIRLRACSLQPCILLVSRK